MPPLVYTKHDLKGLTKAKLAELIHQQIEHWPHRTFNVSRTRRDVMVTELLNPQNGFNYPSETGAMEHLPATPSLPAPPHPTTNHDNSSEQSYAESQTQTASHTLFIHLFLQDRRFTPSRRLAADLEVPATAVSKDFHDCVHISVADLFSKLQCSFARIQAPAIISTPHYLDPLYSQRFAEWTDGQLTDAVFDPSTLRLSVDHRLTIFLDKIPLEQTCQTIPPSESEAGLNTPSRPTDTLNLWLRAKLLDLPRYIQFHENQRRRQLQNSDILEDWKFTAQFYHQYYKTICDSTQRPVTRLAIQGVLEIGETLLTDALVGNRLAARYGPGGPYESAEVVHELRVVRENPLGKGALLKYLENWDTAHPCA